MPEQVTDANCFDSTNPVNGVLARSHYLFRKTPWKQADGANGPWIDVRALKSMSVQVYGTLSGASIQLMGSNDPNPAVSGDAGFAIGSAIAANSIVPITTPYRYIRGVITGLAVGSSISGVLHGVS